MSRNSFSVNGQQRMLSSKLVRRRRLFRTLRVEALERRCVMAADLSMSEEFDANQILIELNDSTFANQILPGGSEQIGHSSWWTVPVTGDVFATVDLYDHLPGVRTAMPDYIVELADHDAGDPNDGMFQGKCLWGLDNHSGEGNICGFPTGVNGADIDAITAWGLMGSNTEDVVVAVIDTGVDYTHPDLAANIWNNVAEIPGNRKDDDNNGYVDDVRGWDFVGRGDNDPMDLQGHGTHVSGTIGAIGNNDGQFQGIVGVAHNNVKIMPLRVFDAFGRGKSSSVVAAINYAVANGAKISNNSYTIGGLSGAVSAATAEGHLFIAAAGNSNSSTPQVPASYAPTKDTVISVAASNVSDRYASFSSFGATVDLAAPGDLIWSTFPISLDRSGDGVQDGYRRMSGTSMATPHVVGAAALVWAKDPGLTAADVKARILGSVDKPSNLSGKTTVTNGRLNAAAALTSSTVTSAASSGGSLSGSRSGGGNNGQSNGADEGIAIVSIHDEASAWPSYLMLPLPTLALSDWMARMELPIFSAEQLTDEFEIRIPSNAFAIGAAQTLQPLVLSVKSGAADSDERLEATDNVFGDLSELLSTEIN